MIYTVTLNPAIDKTVVVNGFASGQVNRVSTIRTDPGGKGINVSKCLKVLGASSIATMLLGGSSGQQLKGMLREAGIAPFVIPVDGETRTNLKIVDPKKQLNTDINEPGPKADGALLELMKTQLCGRIQAGDVVVLSGSLPQGAPAGLYRHWTACFQDLGARVILDADGEPLRLGLQATPYIIKPNHLELARLKGKCSLRDEELLDAGREILQSGVSVVVISQGAQGALFLTKEWEYLAEGLTVPVKSTVGAGDAMVAAMAYSMEKALPLEEAIPLAMAMSAASVMQDGTQPPDMETVREQMAKVKFTRI